MAYSELYYPPTQNGLQKTLGAALDAGVTASMTLSNVTGIQNKPGVVVINRIDSDSAEKSAALREYISYTAVSGSTLTGLTRGLAGTSDQDHAVGSVVEFIFDITSMQALIDFLLVEHEEADGTHDATVIAKLAATQTLTNKTLTTPTLTSPVLNTGVSGTAIADEDDLTSDSATKVPTQQSVKAYVDSGTVTMTNKRVTKRTGTTTSSATPTINTDNVDFYSLTAQAVAITSFTTNLSGTPTEAQTLWIAITGTAARAITWGASFEASTIALPTTTVTTARLDVGFVGIQLQANGGA